MDGKMTANACEAANTRAYEKLQTQNSRLFSSLRVQILFQLTIHEYIKKMLINFTIY